MLPAAPTSLYRTASSAEEVIAPERNFISFLRCESSRVREREREGG